MFGKRGTATPRQHRPKPEPAPAQSPAPAPTASPDVDEFEDPFGNGADLEAAPPPAAPPAEPVAEKIELAPIQQTPRERQSAADQKLQEIKISVFNDLIEAVDLAQLSTLSPEAVREEISDIVSEIISMRTLVLSAQEQQQVISDICNDVLGLGPLEPLLARDDIADIMVNGPDRVYIEVGGKVAMTDVAFRDNAQLMNICQRIVNAVGRRVDEASPICDARLADGSRVNVIAPPLAIDGTALTIRKFKKDKLKLRDLVNFRSVDEQLATVLQIAAASRCNILVSGGTGSGKTTLLNCLSNYIDHGERVITCEDAAELQLQQPHVVRLETRPPNLEGAGEVTMRDLVRNCLRMRPDRIIVGEVRGPEAFDLLQAMNTGHDGSMGTVHANSPREALSRIESMIAMGGFSLPPKATREQVSSALNVIVQAARLRDGSRKVTHVTEVVGMEGDVITLQDLFVYEFEGEDSGGRVVGRHRPTGLRPKFWDRARYFGLELKLAQALEISSA
jgi:pilus assembly protein CpaF